MELESAQNNTTAKLPILKIDENGVSVTKMSVPVTAEEKINKKNDVKARSLLLMALPNEHQLTFIWMNKADIETMSINDLYKNFKIVEQDVKKYVGTSTGAQNIAFMTAPSSSSTNDVNTANYAYEASTDLEQIHEDDLEAIDLRWQLSPKHEGKKDTLLEYAKHKGTKMVGSGIKTILGTATYKRGLATVKEQLVKYKKNEVLFSKEVAVLKREVACKEYEINVPKSEFEKVKQEKEDIEFKIEKFDNALKILDKLIGSQITDNSKKGLRYHAVPPPHPLIYNRPTKLNLSYSGLDEFKDP
nr:hypothetical protein [Tanacetum cinerariifolium]